MDNLMNCLAHHFILQSQSFKGIAVDFRNLKLE